MLSSGTLLPDGIQIFNAHYHNRHFAPPRWEAITQTSENATVQKNSARSGVCVCVLGGRGCDHLLCIVWLVITFVIVLTRQPVKSVSWSSDPDGAAGGLTP